MNRPKISVVMPVYNAERFLSEAIESILNQTFKDFELIIINDGSTDSSLEIINRYKAQDERIVLVNRENRGLVCSLNEGIEKAEGKYIARMDADDISLPTRFEEQIKVLESFKQIDIVGCHYEQIDENSKTTGTVRVPLNQDEICMTLCYTVPFPHASVMIRKEILNKQKYEEFPTEDYLLWSKLYNNKNFYNLDKILLRYRHQYGTSLSDTKRIEMIKAEKEVSKQYYLSNKDHIKRNLNYNFKKNVFYFRGIVNIFLFSEKKTIINFILKNPRALAGFCKYYARHWIRIVLWKIKTSK